MTWIAERTKAFDSSGIRKVFDLAAKMKDPINLSIGQPDFEVPQPVQDACIDAIKSGKNGYALTQGMPVLRDKLQQEVDERFGHGDRKVFVCSGTSGGLVLTMLSLLNEGDEAIIFDPFFVMYESLIRLVGAVPVVLSTYPSFEIDVNQVEAAITDKTKMILVNSPANPTGATINTETARDLAALAERHNVALVSDEIYRPFAYDEPFVSPASFNERAIVIDGFSKSHALTGWRVGYVHGPAEVIDTMIKVQQFTFVCAPQPAQWAAATAMDVDITQHIDSYRKKRDYIVEQLSVDYELVSPGGAFYVFPRAPHGTGTELVTRAIDHNLLIIPGSIFSHQDTHFRISYAAADDVIERGVEVLRKIARG